MPQLLMYSEQDDIVHIEHAKFNEVATSTLNE